MSHVQGRNLLKNRTCVYYPASIQWALLLGPPGHFIHLSLCIEQWYSQKPMFHEEITVEIPHYPNPGVQPQLTPTKITTYETYASKQSSGKKFQVSTHYQMYLHHSMKFNNTLQQIYHVAKRNVNAANACFMVQLKGFSWRVIKRIFEKTGG